MLVILDLDDTLIDTSGCMRLWKLTDAVRVMREAGGIGTPEEELVELMRQINAQAIGARDALKRFVKEIGGGSSLLAAGLKEYYENITGDYEVRALEGAEDLLAWLQKHHTPALVSIGIKEQQLEKLRRARLDAGLFSAIEVTRELDKKPAYRSLMEHFHATPSNVVVCGDKIDIDLEPAKQLGCQAVYMRRPGSPSPPRGVDFTIEALLELQDLAPLAQFAT